MNLALMALIFVLALVAAIEPFSKKTFYAAAGAAVALILWLIVSYSTIEPKTSVAAESTRVLAPDGSWTQHASFEGETVNLTEFFKRGYEDKTFFRKLDYNGRNIGIYWTALKPKYEAVTAEER